jgi:hypothetical protein
MAGSFSNFLENEVLDHVFGAAAYTAPTNIHVALFSAAPSDTGGGTEFSAGNYGRLQVTNNATNFPAASGGAKSNGVDFTFPQASGANWGTAVAVGLFDASTSGNLLAWADLATSKAINVGDTARFASGDLDFTLD